MRRPKKKSSRSWRQLRRDTPGYLMPIAAGEWILETTVDWLGRWAIIDLIRIIGSLSLVWVAYSYLTSADERKSAAESQLKSKHYQAWQMINSAVGMKSDSGRRSAIQDLLADGVSLYGIDLSKSMMAGLNIQGANIADSNFREAELSDACFRRTYAVGADFTGSTLHSANFDYSELSDSSFKDGQFIGATFEGADLSYSDLRDAILPEGIRRAKSIKGANIYRASFPATDSNLIDWALAGGAVCIASDVEWLSFKRSPTKQKFAPEDCEAILSEPDPHDPVEEDHCTN